MTLAFLFESVGAGEWLVLLAVLLIVVGPKRLPATARKFGQYYSKLRRAAESFKRQLLDMDSDFTNAIRDVEKEVDEATKDIDRELQPPDPSEYGGYDDSAQYGENYDNPVETPATATEVEEPKEPKAEVRSELSKSGIKITVSPAPETGETKKAGA